ncbi:hypothetical protein Q7P37_003353 [Cladosporium fusiforme]
MRILMLHGYAQTGDTFKRKLRRLEYTIRKYYPDASFIYLDGPMKLDADDMIESTPTTYKAIDQTHKLELRAWFRLPLVAGRTPPDGLLKSLDYLAKALEHYGPFDGIIAFSQGTVLGGMICSLLQSKERRDSYDFAFNTESMQYPASFHAIKHPPLKFGIFYASRVFVGDYYDAIYKSPNMDTSFCHFFGKWDSMVGQDEQDEVRRMLCPDERSKTFHHSGGHFVPSDRRNNEIAAGFIERCMGVDKDVQPSICVSS